MRVRSCLTCNTICIQAWEDLGVECLSNATKIFLYRFTCFTLSELGLIACIMYKGHTAITRKSRALVVNTGKQKIPQIRFQLDNNVRWSSNMAKMPINQASKALGKPLRRFTLGRRFHWLYLHTGIAQKPRHRLQIPGSSVSGILLSKTPDQASVL